MTLFRLIAMLIMGLGLSACITPYGEYDTLLGGYTDRLINQNTAVINISTTTITMGETAQNYVLYRAAEVTIANGYDYFIVISSTRSNVYTRINEARNYHNYNTNPPRLFTAYYQSLSYHSSKTVPAADIDCRYRSCRFVKYGPTIVIKMYNGRKPHLPNAFTAYDILAHLAPATYQQHY